MKKLRWLARLLSLAVFAFILPFIFGGNEPFSVPTLREWSLLLCFPIGLFVGLAVGWRNETIGGAIGLGSIVAFYGMNLVYSGTLPRGPFFALLALPALMFFCLGVVDRHAAGESGMND